MSVELKGTHDKGYQNKTLKHREKSHRKTYCGPLDVHVHRWNPGVNENGEHGCVRLWLNKHKHTHTHQTHQDKIIIGNHLVLLHQHRRQHTYLYLYWYYYFCYLFGLFPNFISFTLFASTAILCLPLLLLYDLLSPYCWHFLSYTVYLFEMRPLFFFFVGCFIQSVRFRWSVCAPFNKIDCSVYSIKYWWLSHWVQSIDRESAIFPYWALFCVIQCSTSVCTMRL